MSSAEPGRVRKVGFTGRVRVRAHIQSRLPAQGQVSHIDTIGQKLQVCVCVVCLQGYRFWCFQCGFQLFISPIVWRSDLIPQKRCKRSEKVVDWDKSRRDHCFNISCLGAEAANSGIYPILKRVPMHILYRFCTSCAGSRPSKASLKLMLN